MDLVTTLKRAPDFSVYAIFAVFFLLLSFTGTQGEPFTLPLCYALLANGFNLPVTALLFLLTGLLDFTTEKFVVYLGHGAVLFLTFFIYRHLGGKSRTPYPLFLLLALPFFTFLFPFDSYEILYFLPLTAQKCVVTAVLFFLAQLYDSAVYSAFTKILRCKLSADEFLCLFIALSLAGIGLLRLAGELVYFSVSLFLALLYIRLIKNSTAITFAALLAVPPSIVNISLLPIAIYIIYAGMGAFFYPWGKFPCILSIAMTFALFSFFDGVYGMEAEDIAMHVASCAIPCLLFLCLPQKLFDGWDKKLIFYKESHLSRIAVNRNRAAIGEQLFALSNVFRKIDHTFSSVADGNDQRDKNVIAFIREQTKREICAKCSRGICGEMKTGNSMNKLLSIGCAKGKVSLSDVPAGLSGACSNADVLLNNVNKQLAEYKRYMLEAENAKIGRQLLSTQARGISELLKNIALSQSEPLREYSDKEKQLYTTFAKNGILCSEIMLYGEGENIRLDLSVYGQYESGKIVQIAGEILGMPLTIGEKLVLAEDKYCYALRRRPRYDAVFGVASKGKAGKKGNGDTHSVIRIDEKRFLVALSDGMGSGCAAEQISDQALSLLESFYRAGMNSNIILPTVNKLLSFRREDNFVCADIACVDLETGIADVVKIGSPLGFVFSEGAIRVLEGEGLPLGMLDDFHPTTLSVELQENDILVFLSDGITEAFGSSAELLDYLKYLSPLNPQALADNILQTALRQTNGRATDDMTVLTVRLLFRYSCMHILAPKIKPPMPEFSGMGGFSLTLKSKKHKFEFYLNC